MTAIEEAEKMTMVGYGFPGKKITVVGAVNVDICGKSDRPLKAEDSNPGRVTISMGGVGRNIAHNLRLLEQKVSLVTVFGDDGNGQRLKRGMENLGIDISSSRTIPNVSTSCYVSIADEKGEMQLAISDMQICEEMTPQFVADRLDTINDSALCVIDTNLPAETIRFLAEHITVPLFADPVSTTKMHKLEPILDRIHTLKPNRLEAELLTGISITSEASLEKAAQVLLSAGVRRVFISLGGDGVLCTDHSQTVLLPGIPTDVRSTTGGGDCFMAALACAYCSGHTLGESGRLALAAGAICAESEHTINETLSLRGIYERAGLPWPG